MLSRHVPASGGSGRRQRALGKDDAKEGRQKPCEKRSAVVLFLYSRCRGEQGRGLFLLKLHTKP